MKFFFLKKKCFLKKVKKVRNYSFNLYVHSILHIDTHALLRHVAKMGKMKFYGSGNIALGFVFIAAHCNIITP